MNSRAAPIVLFCFNRPQHLLRTINSLKACPEFAASPLYVYSDGPRNEDDKPGVLAVRRLIESHLPESATVVMRPANIGLAANVIEGVTTLCEKYGRVIALEDDLLLDARFLTFMNDALDRYEQQADVFQIAGHIWPPAELSARGEALMLTWTSSWGWATWQRAWRQFDEQASGWKELASDRRLRRRFNLDNTYDYSTMLERQMHGTIQSWAIRWNWSVFRSNALVVYPPFNLVDNLGFDGTGTHGRGLLRRFGRPTRRDALAGSISLPARATLDEPIQRKVLRELRKVNGGWLGHIADRLRRLLWRFRLRRAGRR